MGNDTISTIQNVYMSEYGNKQKYLWDYYDGNTSVIPIYQRSAVSPLKEKSHTNVHTDFFGQIIDLKQGYMGERIEIKFQSEDDEDFKKMLKDTHMATENSQTVEYTSVEGISHRLCYTENGEFKTKNLHGWQVVYEYTNDIFNPERAYYFYSIQELGETIPTNYCNIYDREFVTYYKQDERNKKGPRKAQSNAFSGYVIDKSKEPQPHNFNQVPIIPFLNTADWKSNCDQSVKLMDLYDEIFSDTSAEIKDMRMALLKIWGDDIYTGEDANGNPISIPDFLSDLQAMLFGNTADGKPLGDAEYITRTIDISAVDSMLNKCRAAIFETSGSVDLKELSSAQRVFSIKASLLNLENNAATTENYLRLGLEKQIDLWIYLMGEMGNRQYDPFDFEVHIGRKFPGDEEAQARILSSLVGSGLAVEDALRLAGYEPRVIEGIADRAAEIVVPMTEEVDGEE